MEYIDLKGILAKILFFSNPKCFAELYHVSTSD